MPDSKISKPTEDASVSAKCEAKLLFNHAPGSRHTRWSEFENVVDEEKRIRNLGKDFAVVHRLINVDKDNDAKPYAVSPLFKPYVHRWDEIFASLQHQDTTTKAELQLLRRELQKPLEPHLEALKKVKESGAIDFKLL
ncbi:hypothetical protein CC78DRAFT_588020 [Lojkania enalia]|uniref:Uncharacterized protein n=1 Tax=Lojkania enalia TaxID=147567 RepID=A0A9P4N426_9PLEO|nr:hypothetical protein CC78DRAFT_588020 [Didymosphaeria enalia]